MVYNVNNIVQVIPIHSVMIGSESFISSDVIHDIARQREAQRITNDQMLADTKTTIFACLWYSESLVSDARRDRMDSEPITTEWHWYTCKSCLYRSLISQSFEDILYF